MKRDSSCHVAIIGAGPYGLSAATHLRARQVETRIFGEPMEFWKRHMPQGMFLRSGPHASNLGDPQNRLDLAAYRAARGLSDTKPVPIDQFVSYGEWFQRQAVPELERRTVVQVTPNSRGFHVRTHDGEEFHARHVVVATGISLFAHRPAEFDNFPRELVSHSFDHADLSRLAGQRVAVIGAGQSALESAALLHEAGAQVEIIARAAGRYMIPDFSPGPLSRAVRRFLSPVARPPFDIMGPRFVSWLIAWPRMYRHAPRSIQDFLTARAVRPAGASWLTARLAPIPMTTGCRVLETTSTGSQLRLRLSVGSDRVVDHLLLGTGYRVDVKRYGFLSPELRQGLNTRDGYPVLNVGFESSVAGLHFMGTPSAATFGPLYRFVVGSKYAAQELTRVIAGRNGERTGYHAVQPVLSDSISA
ncbi:MAG TPA: FAD-dependent oxidoreductase [Gemmatimonadales bacterium]|nr:FAD-dependent oxidoreductase [Gemmatimonadales bacterium]